MFFFNFFFSSRRANLDPTPVHILYGHSSAVSSVDVSSELDMVVSGSLDGAVNVHALRSGCFMRRILFKCCSGNLVKHVNVKLSNLRHILIYVQQLNAVSRRISNAIHLYTINGKWICSEELGGFQVQDMLIKDDFCILAVILNSNSSSKQSLNNSLSSNLSNSIESSPNTSAASSSGCSSSSRQPGSKIVFKEIFEFRTLQAMRLKAPITCMFLTREDSHLLVGLKDGKLIVITGDRNVK